LFLLSKPYKATFCSFLVKVKSGIPAILCKKVDKVLVYYSIYWRCTCIGHLYYSKFFQLKVPAYERLFNYNVSSLELKRRKVKFQVF